MAVYYIAEPSQPASLAARRRATPRADDRHVVVVVEVGGPTAAPAACGGTLCGPRAGTSASADASGDAAVARAGASMLRGGRGHCVAEAHPHYTVRKKIV